MKKKVSELGGAELAEWVAKARGWSRVKPSDCFGWNDDDGTLHLVPNYRPDIHKNRCFELIEEYKPRLSAGNVFTRCEIGDADIVAETPQLAICRAVVASVFGEYVGE